MKGSAAIFIFFLVSSACIRAYADNPMKRDVNDADADCKQAYNQAVLQSCEDISAEASGAIAAQTAASGDGTAGANGAATTVSDQSTTAMAGTITTQKKCIDDAQACDSACTKDHDAAFAKVDELRQEHVIALRDNDSATLVRAGQELNEYSRKEQADFYASSECGKKAEFAQMKMVSNLAAIKKIQDNANAAALGTMGRTIIINQSAPAQSYAPLPPIAPRAPQAVSQPPPPPPIAVLPQQAKTCCKLQDYLPGAPCQYPANSQLPRCP